MSAYRRTKPDLFKIMTRDAVRLGQRIPHIHALVELDITQARARLRTYRKTHKVKISLSAYILKACATAIGEMPSIQSVSNIFGHIITPNTVDIFMPVESIHNNEPKLHSTLIRSAELKDLTEIELRLNEAMANNPLDQLSTGQRSFLRLPWLIKKWIYRFWLTQPNLRKRYFGTVYISSIINYSADRRTWGIPLPMHSLGIFIGATSKRLIETKTGVESRDMLQITLTVDHRINNGGDMGRLAHRIKDCLENRDLLNG